MLDTTRDTLFATPAGRRLVGRAAWTMAWFGLVAGQLHALARHNTADGKGDLDLPLTRLWSVPARAALCPLLDWADPDVVYLTYGKIWLPVFVAFTVCAVLVYRDRAPVGWTRWAWRAALTGYAGACLGVLLDYYTAWTGYLPDAVGSALFAVTIVAMVVTLVGSTVLGAALLCDRTFPRLPAWLLALNIPLAVGVLQFTSMGSAALPVMFAFGILGRRIASAPAQEPTAQNDTAQNDTAQNDTVGGVSWPAGAS